MAVAERPMHLPCNAAAPCKQSATTASLAICSTTRRNAGRRRCGALDPMARRHCAAATRAAVHGASKSADIWSHVSRVGWQPPISQ